MSNTDENIQTSPSDLVIIGSSAGGIQALSIFVGTLSPDFPAPIILAQHLDPSRPSNLEHILQRRTTLPVTLVTTSAKLEAGKIYVVPANRHIFVKDHHVEVQGDHAKRPRPSIDALLSSAAEVYGDRLIAVTLTGSGSDGAAGAIEVKNAGGTIIVQDPQTARYPSMPLALPPTIVDFEAKLENIGPLLENLLSGEHIVQAEERTEDTLREILELVSQQASIDFRQYKTSTIIRRISRRMTVTRVYTIRDYVEYLRSFPEEVGELVKAFLINVTQFFRDADAFTYLRNDVLPELIARARERDKVLRFWTAGCATGEEPYSLAMLISDMLGAELSAWSIKIFATDLDEDAINFARRGIYTENLLKAVPDDYQDRFFEYIDHGYRISKILRQMVIFGQQDLSRSAPFPRIDLVLCRNVLIYFSPELQDYVLNQFAFSLSPDGYLFLGKAETVRPLQSHFELVNKQWKMYRCIGTVLPSIRKQALPETAVPRLEGRAVSRSNKSMSTSHDLQDVAPGGSEFGQLRRFNELLLRFLPIGVVVIDRSYHMLTANSTVRRLLGLRDINSDQDFLHAVRGIPYTTIRSAIDAVFRERNAVTVSEVELEVASGGNGRFVSLSMTLMQIESNSLELAAISVTDVTEQVQIRRQLEAVQIEQLQLTNELSTTNKRLSYVNKEVMDANEELQVANEELMLTHEELQASLEEFETTNEELQATNEELETNNEELQATNEELETTNEELRARTSELQEMAVSLDSERVRLAEIVDLAPFYSLVLRGPNLVVVAHSPNYTRLLGGHVALHRPLEEVLEIFWDMQLGMTLIQQAREAYQRDEMRTISRTPSSSSKQDTAKGSNFVYTIVPSHDNDGRVNGVIVYMLDDTEQYIRDTSIDTIKDDFLSLTTHELRTPLTAILGNAQVLLRNLQRQAAALDDGDSLRKQIEQLVGNLDKIVYQTNKINAMLSEMVEVTRLNGHVFELHPQAGVNIIGLVQRVVEQQMLEDGGKHSIEFTTNLDKVSGTVDIQRVEQVLNNLINNALKYSPVGKRVEVSLAYETEAKEALVIAVRDEGYGINAEEQAHVFERFYRASSRERADGLGLGLYIAHEIVTQQSGRIWLESSLDKGSTFYFTLPL